MNNHNDRARLEPSAEICRGSTPLHGKARARVSRFSPVLSSPSKADLQLEGLNFDTGCCWAARLQSAIVPPNPCLVPGMGSLHSRWGGHTVYHRQGHYNAPNASARRGSSCQGIITARPTRWNAACNRHLRGPCREEMFIRHPSHLARCDLR